MDIAVRFRNVALRFGATRALDGVDLEIGDGEFFGILGPSGSGKTSCLRLIAGFERPTQGTIELYGRAAEAIPPYDRDVNTVFQDYALFPHMSVEQNVAYGLLVKRVGRSERRARVQEMLEMVRLEGFGPRRPSELSGGQRQRVALARALINRPRALLLDEPLGALDLKLRQQMQVELRSLQRALGITFIFVTHDQGEALSMSDRLAVFNAGRIEQIGTPREIYERPATRFAAEFVGDSNLVDLRGDRARAGVAGLFSVRPEVVRLAASEPALEPGWIARAGRVSDVQFHGASVRTVVALEGDRSMSVVTHSRRADREERNPGIGERVWLAWRIADMHRLDERSAS
ncbi:MAG: ABC transporter ATP-binding protein [Myxococcales bacterium]|nr:ABC transporter ATP-binding protein [Myxococcales bacterium]MDH5565392.1 ABC transporter ATP-binding protein [Myxococcales bacterium]